MRKATLELVIKRDQVGAASAELDQLGQKGEQSARRIESAFSSTDKAAQRLGDSIRRMREASQANAMASMISATDPFQKQAKSLSDATGAADKHRLSLGRISMALEGLAVEATGANSRIGSIATKFLEFGTGGFVTAAVLGGLALIAVAWDKITEGSRKAEEAQKAAASSISGLRAQQTNPILGNVPHERELLQQRKDDLTSDLAQAQSMSSKLGGTSNLLGLVARGIYGDPEKIKRDLADVIRYIQVAANEEQRLKALANEPTRIAGLESIKNELDINLKREQLRGKIGIGGGLMSGTPKSDLQLELQANAAKLAATKQQIDAQFRVVDATGKELALTKEQQTAKDKLIRQAIELGSLADRQARAENEIAKATNRAQVLIESDSLRDRLKGRIDLINIEKKQEIQKTGDVETAQRRADERIHKARMQQIQELFQKVQSYYEAFISPVLGLDASGRGGKVASVGSGVLSGAMSGFLATGGNPLGAAAGGVIALTTSIIGLGRASKQAADAQAAAQKEFQFSFALYKKGAFGSVSDTDRQLEAARQQYTQYEQQIQELYGGKKNQAQREQMLAEAKRAYDAYVAQIKGTAAEMDKAAKADGFRKSIEDFTNVIDTLRGFQGSIALSNLSVLSPKQQLEEAQRQYDSVLGKARGGDIAAANQLPDVARQLLEIARSGYGSGSGYQAIYQQVMRDTDEIAKMFEAQRTIAQQQLDVLTGIQNGSAAAADQAHQDHVDMMEAIDRLIEETRRSNSGDDATSTSEKWDAV